MLHASSLDELTGELTARSLLHGVLLMAIRDHARCVRIEPSSTALQLFYCAPHEGDSATWYTLAPGPAGLWDAVVDVLREGCEFLPLAGWFDATGRGKDDYPYTTTFTQQIGDYRCPWTLLLDTRRHAPSALFVPSSDTADRRAAGELLSQIFPQDALASP